VAPPTDDLDAEARRVLDGGETTVEATGAFTEAARAERRFDLISSVLINVSRRALSKEGWESTNRRPLAELLKRHGQFGYARRLFGQLSKAAPKDEKLRQQYALSVYKDMELPTARRLDRALEILREGGSLESSTDAETLGLAGAVYKRKWDADAKRADLESSHWCYDRGWQQNGHPQQDYAGVNAAFVLDQLAELEEHDSLGPAPQADELRGDARKIREQLVVNVLRRRSTGEAEDWDVAILAEALFGLGRFPEAKPELAALRESSEGWELETTAMQLAAIARLKRFGATAEAGADRAAQFAESEAGEALKVLLGDEGGEALRRAYLGKVGLALSGGGFRASLFHIGVLARLAERDVLRHVEVLSCVSGGSILGAFYYLKLRRLLQEKPDGEIGPQDYVDLVGELAEQFLDGVREDLRGRLGADFEDNWKMLRSSRYSRTNRAGGLFEELLFSKIEKTSRDDAKQPWLMTELFVQPPGRPGFSPRYENWRRGAKVPILVLNATALNTGHNWQFTASWMGEPPSSVDERVDANPRLRRMYYRDAPRGHSDPDYQQPPLSLAVAASAGVPGLFPPVSLDGLYDDWSVKLVDGGVHDNQGIASLLEQDCTVPLVSDASGQMGQLEYPNRRALGSLGRTNSILMSRVRGAQYADLVGRLRSGTLRRLMIVHLKKGLPARPLDWHDSPEKWDPAQDEITGAQEDRREAYGIHERTQRLLAELRTDLDAFSNAEALSLMAAGYKMTTYEVEDGLFDFPAPDPAPAPTEGWPFAEALAAIAAPPADSGLEVELSVGKSRFFRGFKAWRAGAGEGRLSKLLRWKPLSSARTTAAGARKRFVTQPLRTAVSAPVAAVGALATRISMGIFKRGGNS
jgi:predicted acylesterase/phospholipase RssA